MTVAQLDALISVDSGPVVETQTARLGTAADLMDIKARFG